MSMSGFSHVRLRGLDHSLSLGDGGKLQISDMSYSIDSHGYPDSDCNCTWVEMRKRLDSYTKRELIDLILGFVENSKMVR